MHRQVRFIKSPDDEAAPFHSAMKHFPLRFKYEALRFRFVWCKKMKNGSFPLCNTVLSALYYWWKEIYYGKIFKQARYAFCWFCGWYIEIGQIFWKNKKKQLSAIKSADPEPVSEPTSTKRNMHMGKRILFLNCKLPWKKQMKQVIGFYCWTKQTSLFLQNIIDWKIFAKKSELPWLHLSIQPKEISNNIVFFFSNHAGELWNL